MFGDWMDEYNKIRINITPEDIEKYEKEQKSKNKEIKLSLKDKFALWLLGI